jgi:L-fuculose-phosphate aldolase
MLGRAPNSRGGGVSRGRNSGVSRGGNGACDRPGCAQDDERPRSLLTVTSPRFDAAARADLAAAGRRVAEAGLVLASAGNVSLRDKDRVLISRRGVELDVMDEGDCIEVETNGTVVPGDETPGARPSSELPLHLAIYRGIPSAKAIVHTHSHYATVLSTVVTELPAIHYAIHRFGGPIRVARYETFGTQELADSVIEALQGRTAALMGNHGAIVAGRNIEGAVSMAIQLEWLASIYYHAIQCGTPNILTDAEISAVREQVRELFQVEAR